MIHLAKFELTVNVHTRDGDRYIDIPREVSLREPGSIDGRYHRQILIGSLASDMAIPTLPYMAGEPPARALLAAGVGGAQLVQADAAHAGTAR